MSKNRVVKILLVALGALVAVSALVIAGGAIDNTTSSHPTTVVKTPQPVIEQREESETISIPYTTQHIEDDTLAKGTSKTIQQGVAGSKRKVYSVEYTDGVQTKKVFLREEVITEPVPEIIADGTYVAPTQSCANGTYVNTYGQTVCRPSTVNTGGATAVCRDGTYSYSRSRRGTCSHHGGVKTWL